MSTNRPSFIDRIRGRTDHTHEELDEAAPRIRDAHPVLVRPESFAERNARMAQEADEQLRQLEAVTDQLRAAEAENSILRLRCADLIDQRDADRAQWEEAYRASEERCRFYSRQIDGLHSRVDAIVEACHTVRQEARRGAYEPVTPTKATEARQVVLTEQDVADMQSAPSTIGRVPPNEFPATKDWTGS